MGKYISVSWVAPLCISGWLTYISSKELQGNSKSKARTLPKRCGCYSNRRTDTQCFPTIDTNNPVLCLPCTLVKGHCRDQQSWGKYRTLVVASQILSAHGVFTPCGLSCCFWLTLALAGMVAPTGWSVAKYVGLKDKTDTTRVSL